MGDKEREGELERGRGRGRQENRHQKAKSIDTNRADSSGRSNPQVKSFCHFQILRLAEANPMARLQVAEGAGACSRGGGNQRGAHVVRKSKRKLTT